MIVVYISLMLFFFAVAYSCFVCVKILTGKRDKENPEVLALGLNEREEAE